MLRLRLTYSCRFVTLVLTYSRIVKYKIEVVLCSYVAVALKTNLAYVGMLFCKHWLRMKFTSLQLKSTRNN